MEELQKLAGGKLLDSAIFEGEDIMVDEKERYILIVEGLFYVAVWEYQVGQLLVVLDVQLLPQHF